MKGNICMVFLISIVCNVIPEISGLKCYACVQSGTTDRRCELDPQSVPNSVITCNKKYCVIRRIEYIDEPGKVFSFYRGCEQQPDYTNAEITDSQFKTYYRSCTTDLCNSGDGTDSSYGDSDGEAIDSDGSEDDSAILVPGLGNAASNTHSMPITIFLLIGVIYFMCI